MLDPLALIRIVRSGFLQGIRPQPQLLESVLRAPFRATNLATAVRLHANLRPDATALVDDRGACTWRELQQEVQQSAHRLLRHGGTGKRLIVAMRNCREMVALLVAASRAGWIAVPLNTWSGEGELKHILQNQQPGLIVAHNEFADALRALAPSTPLYRLAKDGSGTWCEARATEPCSEVSVRGGGRLVIHTSGTTGRPKGAERDVEGSGLATLGDLLERVPLRQEDRFYVAPPLFHTLAFGMMSASLVLGCTLYLRGRFEPESTLEWMCEHGISAMAAVPVMVQRTLDADRTATAESLRILLTSGAATTGALRDRIRDRLGAVHYDLYGATEAGWATIATPEDHQRKPNTVGRPGKRMAIHVVKEGFAPCAPRETGDIWIDSGWAFQGYTNLETRTEAPPGWITVGDRGYVDEEGYLFINGRTDDMVIIGGENVYPSEVEEILAAHPAIRECAVIGVPDDDLGQVLAAFVALRSGQSLEADALRTYVRERLARYKAPRIVRFIDDLPRNATGKVLRRVLLDSLAAED